MKDSGLTQDDYEFIRIMAARPTTDAGKQLVKEAADRFDGRINWGILASTMIQDTPNQRKEVEDLIGPCTFL